MGENFFEVVSLTRSALGEKVGQRGALHYPLFYDDINSLASLEGGCSWCSNLWFYSDSGVGKKTYYPRPHHSITRYGTLDVR